MKVFAFATSASHVVDCSGAGRSCLEAAAETNGTKMRSPGRIHATRGKLAQFRLAHTRT